jgi:hypothetical protein
MTLHGSVESIKVAVPGSADFGFRICPELRQTRIENLQPAIFRDENILRLQIAVNDSFAVRRRQAVRDLQRILRGLAHRQRPAGHLSAQRPAFEQFTYEINFAPASISPIASGLISPR